MTKDMEPQADGSDRQKIGRHNVLLGSKVLIARIADMLWKVHRPCMHRLAVDMYGNLTCHTSSSLMAENAVNNDSSICSAQTHMTFTCDANIISRQVRPRQHESL